MMDKDERKQLYTVLEKRILAGESKSKIYAEYPDDKDSQLVARLLAQIPTSARRKQFSLLNQTLIVTIGIMTCVKLIIIALLVLLEMSKRDTLFFAVSLSINIYLIWAVAKFRGASYLLVVGFGIKGLSNIMEDFEEETNILVFAVDSVNFICITAAIALALVLMKKLLPQSTCFFFPKKDKSGNPVFED